MIPFCRLRCKNSLRACDMAALLIMTILVLQALIHRSFEVKVFRAQAHVRGPEGCPKTIR